MEEELDVFKKVKSSGRCGALINLLLMFGLMGINALQDAQPPGRRRPFLLSVNVLSAGHIRPAKQLGTGKTGPTLGEFMSLCRT